jgi:hypothetical protein
MRKFYNDIYKTATICDSLAEKWSRRSLNLWRIMNHLEHQSPPVRINHPVRYEIVDYKWSLRPREIIERTEWSTRESSPWPPQPRSILPHLFYEGRLGNLPVQNQVQAGIKSVNWSPPLCTCSGPCLHTTQWFGFGYQDDSDDDEDEVP